VEFLCFPRQSIVISAQSNEVLMNNPNAPAPQAIETIIETAICSGPQKLDHRLR
jgi:hypothetical protein